jgi:hypothetical protein
MVRLPGWPGCAFWCQLLNRAEDWRNSTAAEKLND